MGSRAGNHVGNANTPAPFGAQPSRVRYRPVIRVFVSSTFNDLKHERDALQQHVFLPLEQFCAARRFQFQAIDLRWGVPSEASFDHRTMRICFKELSRAQELSPKPNFLVLLGNRYGWRPLPEEISPGEYAQLEREAKSISPAALEILEHWYWQDKNADPPTHILQRRTTNSPDGKDYQDKKVWAEVEKVLWSIINSAFRPDRLRQRFEQAANPGGPLSEIVRFQASATEQEIWGGALRVPDAREHVLACFREIDNFESFPRRNQRQNFIDLAENSDAIDAGPQMALDELKRELAARLGNDHIFAPREPAHLVPATGEKGQPTADVTTGHLEQMCQWVFEKLRAIIVKQIDAYWGTSEVGAVSPRELEFERRDHELFGQDRAPVNAFVGREDELGKIADYLGNDSHQPLVLHGASGCGKTSVMARAAQRAAVLKPIVRFLGVTPRSSDVRSLLTMLCRELREQHPLEAAISSDLNEIIKEFHEQLGTATPENPIVLFLDALDQLSDADNGRSLNWIPFGELPENVKLIVSCLSDRPKDDPAGQPYAALSRRRLAGQNLIDLDALSIKEARELLFKIWLPLAGRLLTGEQRDAIERRLDADSARQPLYLKILFEECRLWRSFDPLPADIGRDVPALLHDMLERLGNPAHHGLILANALGYIASAHRGLSEAEILEVLYKDPDYKKSLDQWSRDKGHHLPQEPPRIPVAIWSRLRFDLAPFLAEQGAPGGGTVLNFYHRQLAESVRAHFLDTPLQRQTAHERLADYFDDLTLHPWFMESLEDQRARARRLPPTPRPADVRKVDELPWQRLQAALQIDKDNPKSPYWDKVADLLMNWEFLEAKTEAQA